jgi:glycosyltransferase involved in cell wall biosynthesis
MRITFVISYADFSGGIRVVATYAQKLQELGHDVAIVSRPKRAPTLKEKFLHRFLHRQIPSAARPNAKSHLDALTVRKIVIDRHRAIVPDDLPDADVLVPTWWETLQWVWPAPPSKGAKVHFMQDYEIFGGDKAAVDATCRLPVQRIVIAQWVKNLLAREFNDTTPVLIPNAVDTARFHSPPRAKPATPTVGTLYTAFRNKGTDVALEAYRLARQQMPDLKLVMFGSDIERDYLPIPREAEFLQNLPDEKLPGVYARCDAWLFGTRIEGFGLPILEAMACRTPVIATPAGAAPELLAGGGGALVPMEDCAAMAREIQRIVTLPDPQWQQMSAAAYHTATRYTWDDAAARFEAVLKRAAGIA